MDAIGYVRRSKQEKDVEAFGLLAQAGAIEDYASAHGLKLRRLFTDDGVSGGKPLIERPAGRELITDAFTTPAAIIALRQDRLFRSISDAVSTIEDLHSKGIDVVCIAEGFDLRTPAGELAFNVLAAIAQYERRIIGQRTREAMQVKKDRGEQISRDPPYGFHFALTDRTNKQGKRIKKIVENLEEQRVIAAMIDLHNRKYPYRRIAEALANQGMLARGGNRFAPKVIRDIIRAEKRRRKDAARQAEGGTDK